MIDNSDTQEELIGKIRELQKEVDRLNAQLKEKRFGLTWIDVPEAFEKESENKIPILEEVSELAIHNDDGKPTHILIEGDNYHALTCLNYTHHGKVDVIYIDPPYNTGGEDFLYKDKRFLDEYPDGTRIPSNHPLKHSSWLSFMKKRLLLAKDLLSDKGVMIVHIDEHEINELTILLETEVFTPDNNLGVIVWNKLNPKGDPHAISVMHEYILVFCKNKEAFNKLDDAFTLKKPNAQKIIDKAKSLYEKIGTKAVPDDIKEMLKQYRLPKTLYHYFEIEYNLETINKEFASWIKRSQFKDGEKAYCYIDENGDAFQSVSMGWPNKETPSDDYFIPLIHPINGMECPVPKKGWRNPSTTMSNLLGEKAPVYILPNMIIKGEIVFTQKKNGENNQPRRKYLLKENMTENMPSIYEDGSSDDQLMDDIGLSFPYPKSTNVSKYLLRNIFNNAKVVLDFFAGSGTTLHALMELNEEDQGKRQCILVQSPEKTYELHNGKKKALKGAEILVKKGIDHISDVTYLRNKIIMQGYSKKNGFVEGLGNSLKYYRTSFVGKNQPKSATDDDKLILARKAGCLLGLAENTLYEMEATDYYQFYTDEHRHWTCIYFQEDYSHFEEFRKKVVGLDGNEKSVYVFCWTDGAEFAAEFEFEKNITVKSIPQPILNIYKSLNA